MGLKIEEAEEIRAWMDLEGETFADFLFANGVFLMNASILVYQKSSILMLPIRLAMVGNRFRKHCLKDDKFWKNKRRNTQMNITYKGSFR